jgi:threonine dehydrogenase-like Zn-dependent dehydrogenase
MKTMRAARMHRIGGPMLLEEIPTPDPGPTDVLVAVKACGMVPNLGNVLANWTKWFPELPLPKLPAIFGLDPAGVVEKVGSQVHSIRPGERVYVNPGRWCGSCPVCRAGEPINCRNYTFNGYFGFGPDSQKIYDMYPYGGFCEYMPAPQYAVVKLPDNVSFEQAARFGYLGTAYAALKKAKVGAASSVLINGITGTLGLGAVLLALGMGATRILGTARNQELLDRVKALSPARIDVLSIGKRPIAEWAMQLTGGDGLDVMIDCRGPGSPASDFIESLRALRRGGRAVDIGGMSERLELDVHTLMDDQISLVGSNWSTPGDCQEMAEMARVGTLDLSVLVHRRFPLSDVNKAIASLKDRNGGFSNYVVVP